MTQTPDVPPQMPRRRVEPLPPPPGTFDTVLHRAHARRHRRLTTLAAVTGVFLAGLWGGLAMAGGVAGVQDTVVSFANKTGDLVKADEPTKSPTPSSAAVVKPTGSHPTSAPVTTSGTAAATGPARMAMVRGLVVDGDGAPVVGMFVYTGVRTGGSFIPRATPSAVTNDQGRYAVPCTDAPVLLTPWTLNESRAAAKGRWAATYVASPTCSTEVASTVTEVRPSASVEGHVITDKGCAASDFSLWLWLNGNRPTAVRLGNLNEGDAFKISGLPEGTHILGAHGRHIPVTVDSGGHATQDVTFPCPDETTGTPSPTTTPSELPTPTDTTTPDPSESPTPTGTSTAGGG